MTTNEEIMNEKAKALEEQYGAPPQLDLSKVMNVKANKQQGIDVENIVKTTKKRKNKFCFTDETEVELPTKGYLYQDCEDSDIKRGIVRLRPMSLADEEILANQTYIKNGTVFAHLLNSCMLNNFDADNFVSYDVYYLIYALRQITYGEDYTFDVICPNCEKNYKYDLKISDVEFEQLESKENPIKEIKLPVSKFTIKMRPSVLGDESKVYKLSRDSDYLDSVLEYVARTIEILDDQEEKVDENDWCDFFTALPGRDRSEITNKFKNIEGMKVPTVSCNCPKCQYESKLSIPFNRNFFRY